MDIFGNPLFCSSQHSNKKGGDINFVRFYPEYFAMPHLNQILADCSKESEQQGDWELFQSKGCLKEWDVQLRKMKTYIKGWSGV